MSANDTGHVKIEENGKLRMITPLKGKEFPLLIVNDLLLKLVLNQLDA